MRARKAGKKSKRSLAAVIAALVLFYLVASFFLGEQGVVNNVRLRGEKASLEREVGELKESNAALTKQVDMLKDDPEYIERLAREQGLARQGELVYQYEKDK